MKNFKSNLFKKISGKILTYFIWMFYAFITILLSIGRMPQKEFILWLIPISIITFARFLVKWYRSGFLEDYIERPLFFVMGFVLGAYFFASMTFDFLINIDRWIRGAAILFVFAYPTLRLIFGPDYQLEKNKHRELSVVVMSDILKYIIGFAVGTASYFYYAIITLAGLAIGAATDKIIELVSNVI